MERPGIDELADFFGADAAGALRQQFPSVPFERVRLIDEGGDFANYDIDDALVVRIPRDAGAARCLAVERNLLPRLRPLLPVEIPVFAYVGEPDARLPFGLAAYRKLHGLSGEAHRPAPADRPRCARRLGATLSALHTFPLDEARACGVPDRPARSPAWVLERVAGYAPLIRREMPELGATPEIDAYLSASIAPPPTATIGDVLMHHDLKGEHYLLNERADDIGGIIDWADARVGDPAQEFVGVAIWLGMPFVEQVLEHYTLPVDAGFVDRVRFYSQSWRLIHLGMTLANEWDAPLELILTQLRWAFSTAK